MNIQRFITLAHDRIIANVKRSCKGNHAETCRNSATGISSRTCRLDRKHTEERKDSRRQAIPTCKGFLQSGREKQEGAKEEKRISFPLPLFFMLSCMFMTFWLGYFAKPSHNFAFEDYSTYHFSLNDWNWLSMLFLAVIFALVGDWFYIQKVKSKGEQNKP